MLILTTQKLLLIALGSCVLLPFLLGVLARNRGKRVFSWVLVGMVPVINIMGLIVLLWTPLLAEQEALERQQDAYERAYQANQSEQQSTE